MKTRNEKPSVDIIVPVYNTPSNLLECCILSILGQTYTNIRAIIIDDGSTNKKTLEILKKYSNRIKVVTQKNAGVSEARNNGLRESKSDYVFFLDSDDYIDKDCIEKLINVLKAKRAKLVFSGKVKTINGVNDSPFREHMIDLTKDKEVIVKRFFAFTSQGVLIDGRIARSVSFTATTTTTGEDTEYIIKAMARGRTYFYGLGGYNYVCNYESISHSADINSIRRLLSESVILGEVFKKYLGVSGETVNVYLYLKIIHACRLLTLSRNWGKGKIVIKEHIRNNINKKPTTRRICMDPLLSIGQKVRIGLLRNGLYDGVYCFNKIMDKIKAKQ